MELTPPLPYHTLDQRSHTGLSLSALGFPYVGEKYVCIKVIMMLWERASTGMSRTSKRIKKKELLTFLEV